MEFEQKPRGLTPKPRPFGRIENSWASPDGDVRSTSPVPRPVTPKSPVSSSSPWPINSNNFNAMPEKFRARRRSSFEDGVDARPASPYSENGELSEEKIFITHVESPIMFWAQTAEEETAKVF